LDVVQGGFFLRKKPLGFPLSVKSRIENAVAAFDRAGLRKKLAKGRPFSPCFLDMAINYGYNLIMDVSTAEAKNRLPELIRAVEGGEQVIITRHGRPVAQIAPPPAERREVRFDGMKDRIRLLPGWDDPIDLDRFLEGDL
jgi:prevent-host-death family protein